MSATRCYDLEVSQRADQLLALQLLDSVGEPEAEIERAWRDEVRQRLAEIDAGRAKLVSWDEAKRRIFARR